MKKFFLFPLFFSSFLFSMEGDVPEGLKFVKIDNKNQTVLKAKKGDVEVAFVRFFKESHQIKSSGDPKITRHLIKHFWGEEGDE